MKRLTDERIAALIDMVPLNEAIADIKSALVELQEYRKSDGEPVAWLHVNKFGTPAMTTSTKVAEDWYLNGFDVQPLYTAPQPGPIAPVPNEIEPLTNNAYDYVDGWNACRAAMLQAGALTNEGTIQAGNLPVIPDGWALVPKKLTTEMRKAAREVFGIDDIDIEWSHLLAAAPKSEDAK